MIDLRPPVEAASTQAFVRATGWIASSNGPSFLGWSRIRTTATLNVMAELPPIDHATVPAFSGARPGSRIIPSDLEVGGPVERFGDNAELADELLDLVLHGPKRATAGSVAAFEQAGEPLPKVGDLWIAADASGRPRAVLRTTEARTGPLSTVDDAFLLAWDEGEGDRSRSMWLNDHETFFVASCPPSASSSTRTCRQCSSASRSSTSNERSTPPLARSHA